MCDSAYLAVYTKQIEQIGRNTYDVTFLEFVKSDIGGMYVGNLE